MARSLASSLLLFALATGCMPAASSPNASPSPSPSETSGVAAGRTRERTIVEVQNDVRQMMEAYYRGDVEALFPYFERLFRSGGFASPLTDADIRRLVQQGVDRRHANGFALESLAFHEPPKFSQTDERLYAIVPYTLVEQNQTTGERVQSISSFTGVLERDADGFFYLEGPQPVDKLREKFPDLPQGYTSPEQIVTTLTPGRSEDGNSPASTERTPESMQAELQADVSRRVEAMLAGDAETLLRYMPDEMKRVAGDELARDMVQQGIETVRALNVDLESVEFPDAPTIYRPSERTFAIVPYYAIMRSRDNGRRIRLLDYAIGILEPGAAEFRYIEAGLTLAKLRVIYPDFPEDARFPRTGVRREGE